MGEVKMIKVKNLSHDYSGKGNYAVKEISFQIDRGEIFGFLGPSGAGKSTVQNIMTGLLRLQSGEVTYEDKPIESIRKQFFNRIGVSFEHPNLYTKLSGYENLRYYAGLFTVPTLSPLELLDMVSLRESAYKKVAAYSKGMKQRLVFARALINNPDILFLDEPTASLDPVTATHVKDIILEKKKQGVTVFLTTHNMYTAEEICDRVAFLNEGTIAAMDTPRDLKLKYGEKSVRVEYLEDGRIKTDLYFLSKDEDRVALQDIVGQKEIQTLHSQEASLEQIFIRLTGRGLQA
jgi:fluoroquinolone transport system ATP-binding protein